MWCDDFCSIEEYGNAKEEWFKGFLDLKHGIPSHDTFSDVLNRLKPKEFSQAFTQWVSQLGNLKGDIVSIDGKSREQRLYITSHGNKDAKFIASAIRSHWFVENKRHWQLDVNFNDE